MFNLSLGILIRILSNSYLNVFQKVLTNRKEHPSVINFYTYLGLTTIGFIFCPMPEFTQEIIINLLIMGFLGALGNYFIIKALSCGELSGLAPINSYKPIVALVLGIIMLKEIPNLAQVLGIFMIIIGTLILSNNKVFYSKAILYRFFALIFSGTEAIFIKKIIILTDIPTSFLLWALASLIFTAFFAIASKHQIKIKKENIRFQFILVLLVALMQYATNYVFSKMNVAYALALFQLSTILSVFLGVNIFKEEGLTKKVLASSIMIMGASIIFLN